MYHWLVLSLYSDIDPPPPPQASKDIVRVVEWKDVECFSGYNYKKFYRAPGPHCFSLVVRGLN